MTMTQMADDSDMDSLYASGENEGPSRKGKESMDREEMDDDATALVPMKILMGKSSEPVKEGDEVVLKVVAVHGSEAEVCYSETKPGEIGEGEEGPSANEEIDSMDKSNPGTY